MSHAESAGPAPERVPPRARAGSLRLAAHDAPATRLLGRCKGCGRLVFDRTPHQWANRDTQELCRPHDIGAALYCSPCSDDLPAPAGQRAPER